MCERLTTRIDQFEIVQGTCVNLIFLQGLHCDTVTSGNETHLKWSVGHRFPLDAKVCCGFAFQMSLVTSVTEWSVLVPVSTRHVTPHSVPPRIFIILAERVQIPGHCESLWELKGKMNEPIWQKLKSGICQDFSKITGPIGYDCSNNRKNLTFFQGS